MKRRKLLFFWLGGGGGAPVPFVPPARRIAVTDNRPRVRVGTIMTSFEDIPISRLCEQPLEFDFTRDDTGGVRDVSTLTGGFVIYDVTGLPIVAEKVGVPVYGLQFGIKSRMRFLIGATDLGVTGSYDADLLLRDPTQAGKVVGRWNGHVVVEGVR